jgi:hypothetical protein
MTGAESVEPFRIHEVTLKRESVTCFGIIMECAPKPVLHLSSGLPCCTEFRDFGFA